jgi:hypothetical protein
MVTIAAAQARWKHPESHSAASCRNVLERSMTLSRRRASLGLASTFQQTTSAGKAGIVVRIVVVKVFRFQSATETFLKAADAKTATPKL